MFANISLDESVHITTCLAERRGVVHEVEWGKSEAFRKTLLCNVEALGKFSIVNSLIDIGPQAVDGSTKEQLRSDIQCEVEEERLQVNDPIGHAVYQIPNVFMKVTEVLILRPDELLS
jgi:hypothetical protein